MPMIEIRDVSKRYGDFEVLKHCSTSVEKGDVVVVCGPSGSGKSTLIKTVNGLEPFQEGEIYVDGIPVHDRRTNLPKLRARIGMVFQNFELFPHLSVMRNLVLAQTKVLGRPREEAEAKGMALLERVGLKEHAHKYPGQLSGGQQQRVFLARALAQEAQVLLLDEPVSGVDAPSQHEIFDLLHRLQGEGKTVVVTTHDLSCVAERFDLALLLNGRVVSLGKPEEVFTPELLNEAYQSHLMVLEIGGRTITVEDGNPKHRG